MKELHPEAYDLLSRVRVPAHAAGEPGALYTPFPESGYPVLGHDADELVQVRWNNDDRSVMRGLKADAVEEWYDAIRLWNECLTSPDSEYWVQLQPGTAVGASIYVSFLNLFTLNKSSQQSPRPTWALRLRRQAQDVWRLYWC